MGLEIEWKKCFKSNVPAHDKTTKMVLDWYKQDAIKIQIVLDELEILSNLAKLDIHQNSIICKTWHGRRYEVSVLKDGFLYDNELYQNLTSIATKITGTHQSGNVFFGLARNKNES